MLPIFTKTYWYRILYSSDLPMLYDIYQYPYQSKNSIFILFKVVYLQDRPFQNAAY